MERKDVKLTLSEIITRSDDETLADKVNFYNELLANYGLHLNKKGTAVLAKNIKLYPSNNMHRLHKKFQHVVPKIPI